MGFFWIAHCFGMNSNFFFIFDIMPNASFLHWVNKSFLIQKEFSNLITSITFRHYFFFVIDLVQSNLIYEKIEKHKTKSLFRNKKSKN